MITKLRTFCSFKCIRYLYHEVQDKRIRMFTTRYNGSLEEKISQMKAKGQSFSAQKVAKLFLDLVFGLQFLHEHKVRVACYRAFPLCVN